ncbi:hypothetical protein [Neorhizobium sp. DAR64872/K0K18]|uniref:hypothetical protein n=1 Tax=Neorhizobium sp. DAR64872/K0K18 TaxID=3421958 RepID=UPI003D2A626B
MFRFLKRLAIKYAMRKPAPDRIPLSDMERVRQRDYFVVTFGPEGDRQRFLVRQVLPEGFSGLWFLGETSNSEERTIPNSDLDNYEVLITHYFGELEIRYSRASEFILKHFFRYEYLPYARERLGRYFFNRRTLDEKRRIHVLRMMLDSHLSDNPLRSVMDIMSELYGPRWSHHPQQLQLYRYYELMVNSFIEAAELTRTQQNGIEIAPQAINTLDAYNEEERRHGGTMSIQRWMLIVTAMVGIATAIQAYGVLFPPAPEAVISPLD